MRRSFTLILKPATVDRGVRGVCAVGSAQSRLLPQGRKFSELAGQAGELRINDGIEGAAREIRSGD